MEKGLSEMTLDYSNILSLSRERASKRDWKEAVRMQEGILKDVVGWKPKEEWVPRKREWPTVLTVPKKTNGLSVEMGPSRHDDILSGVFATLATFPLRSTSVLTRSSFLILLLGHFGSRH